MWMSSNLNIEWQAGRAGELIARRSCFPTVTAMANKVQACDSCAGRAFSVSGWLRTSFPEGPFCYSPRFARTQSFSMVGGLSHAAVFVEEPRRRAARPQAVRRGPPYPPAAAPRRGRWCLECSVLAATFRLEVSAGFALVASIIGPAWPCMCSIVERRVTPCRIVKCRVGSGCVVTFRVVVHLGRVHFYSLTVAASCWVVLHCSVTEGNIVQPASFKFSDLCSCMVL